MNHGPDLSETNGNRLPCLNKNLFSSRFSISVSIQRAKSVNRIYLKFIHSVFAF